MLCGPLCGVRQPFSRAGLRRAIRDGDLDLQGRCLFCGSLAQVEVQAPLAPTRVGPKCLCWCKPIHQCPKHGVNVVAPARAQQKKASTSVERVNLPYKKQTCDIVVRAGPLELVYPALVSEEQQPQGAATLPKVDMGEPVELLLSEAPEWLANPLECLPYSNAAAPAKDLSAEEEFALLRARLTKLGKAKNKAARAERLERQASIKASRAATQRKVEEVAKLVVLAREQIALAAIWEQARAAASAPLTPGQQEFVSKSCGLAREEYARREHFSAVNARQRAARRSAPYVLERRETSTPAVRVCTVPWAGIDVPFALPSRGSANVGTLGSKSAPSHGDYTCDSSLGLPTRRQAVSVMASSLRRARRVVRATIKFVKEGLSSLNQVVREVAHKIKTKVPPLLEKVTLRKQSINKQVAEEQLNNTSWQGCQLPEMGVRNIYVFSDQEETQPEEVIGNNTSWQGCQLPEMGVRNIYVFSDEEETQPEEVVENNTSWQGCQLPEMGVKNIYVFSNEEEMQPEEVVKNNTSWQGCQLPEMGVRNIYVFSDEGEMQSEEVVENNTSWQGCQLPEMGVRNIYVFSNEETSPEEDDKLASCKTEGAEKRINIEEQKLLKFLKVDQMYTDKIRERYCTNRGYYLYTPVKHEESAHIVRSFPPTSLAFELEMDRRARTHRMRTIDAELSSTKEWMRCNYFICPKDGWGSYLPFMSHTQKSYLDCDYEVINYNPDRIGCRETIHTYFIYRAECLEGCTFEEDSRRSKNQRKYAKKKNKKNALDSGEIEELSHGTSSAGEMFYASMPIVSRGNFRSCGSVLDALMSYMPHMSFTCDSALGSKTEAEITERMQDRDSEPITTIDTLVSKLATRKGKVLGAGENRVADRKELTEEMVFHQPGIISRMKHKGARTRVAVNHNSDQVIVRKAKAGEPTFTQLPRMSEEQMRKLLEGGFGSTSTIALDIGMQSHIPQGMPIVAFVNIMDTRFEDPFYSSLCGSYIDLGRERAKTLCLPLTNFPLSKEIEEVDDVLHGLTLATYVTDKTGYTLGKPMFSYGTAEFQEYKESAYSDFSRVRDKWDAIAKQQNTPGDRVLAGFSVLGAVSQEYNQSLPEFDSINLKCPPSNKPIVATYREPQKLLRCGSTRSFRMPKLGMPNTTGRATIPIQTDVRQTTRIASGEELTPPRYATCDSGFKADTSLAHIVTGWCPKDATQGTVLEAINLREDIATSDNLAKYEWLATGMIKPSLKLKITAGSNPFIGLSLGICSDFFGRLGAYADGDTQLPREVALQLPNKIYPLSEGSHFEAEIDMAYMGYNLFQTQKGFFDPFVFIYVLDTNSLPASDSWRYTIRVCLESVEHATNMAISPLVTLPGTFNGRLEIDVWRGPFSFTLGSNGTSSVNIGIDVGGERTYTTGKTLTSFPAAYAQLLSGIGGVLHGEVVQTGSRAIACTTYLTLQPSDTTKSLEQALLLPGVELPPGGGKFALRIQTAFQRLQVLSKAVQLVIYAVGGPIGVASIMAPYQFVVRFSHIQEEEGTPPRAVGTILNFSWASITNFTNSDRFQIPARLSDLVLPGKTVHMSDNPLAKLIASSGFFRGHVTFVFKWSLNVAHVTPKATIQILTCVGTLSPVSYTQVIQTDLAPLGQVFEFRIPMDLIDYPGFNTSGGIGLTHHQPFLDVWSDDFTVLTSLNISVVLQPGFELYGRSITPLT